MIRKVLQILCILMVRIWTVQLLLLVVFLLPAFGAQRDKIEPSVRPLAVSDALRTDLARYSLRAYENCDKENVVQALLFTPKPNGRMPLPVVIYIPGNGEIGDVARQFRQCAIFERVTSAKFQEKYPCFLIALTPPTEATTILGGMPGHPTRLQKALRNFILDICRVQTKVKVDMNRLYLTGFSYGGVGAYALAQHFPDMFAAVVPIAALPPLPEYFDRTHPGNWWHFHNEGNYNSRGVDMQDIEAFAKLVNNAGGDFRIGTFPANGHDAWTKTWREDVVWKWMFSKSLKGRSKQIRKRGLTKEAVPISLSSAVCTASVPGVRDSHGPERVIDGLDATWYESSSPFSKSDWWQVDLIEPMRGQFTIVSGDSHGKRFLKSGFAEVSVDGKRWMRMASFSQKNGICTFISRKRLRFLRVRSTDNKAKAVCLRLLKVVRD